MSAWKVKLVLGSLALLASPWLGEGGRARAGFTTGQLVVLPSAGNTRTFNFGLRPALSADPRQDSAMGVATEDVPSSGGQGNLWLRVRAQTPTAPEAAEGMSSAPPVGSSAGGGHFAALPEQCTPAEVASGRLFLVEGRFQVPPFASRLFRPPRDVA